MRTLSKAILAAIVAVMVGGTIALASGGATPSPVRSTAIEDTHRHQHNRSTTGVTSLMDSQRNLSSGDSEHGREMEPGDDKGRNEAEAGDDNERHEAEAGDDKGRHEVEPGDDKGRDQREARDDSGHHSGRDDSGRDGSGNSGRDHREDN